MSLGRTLYTLAACVVLVDCTGYRTWRAAPAAHDSELMGARQSQVMRRIVGRPDYDAPLLPEPGDIWADVLPKPAPPLLMPQSPSSAPPAASTAGETGAEVQLAAAPSAQQAHAAWQRLRRHAPQLVANRTPLVVAALSRGREVWRLRTGGFATIAEAKAYCSDIRAEHGDCWVVPH